MPTTVTEHPPVIGIDTNSFGFHVVSSRPIPMTGLSYLPEPSCQGWTQAKSKDSYERLRVAHDAALRFFATLPRASCVFVEEALILPKNIETTRKLVLMTGVLYAAFLEARPDATWFWVNVSTWRRVVLAPPKGQSPRNKEGWKAMAAYHVHSGWAYPSFDALSNSDLYKLYEDEPDLYDAHCLMEYGCKVLTSGEARIQ
jgi:hypothetical protein